MSSNATTVYNPYAAYARGKKRPRPPDAGSRLISNSDSDSSSNSSVPSQTRFGFDPAAATAVTAETATARTGLGLPCRYTGVKKIRSNFVGDVKNRGEKANATVKSISGQFRKYEPSQYISTRSDASSATANATTTATAAQSTSMNVPVRLHHIRHHRLSMHRKQLQHKLAQEESYRMDMNEKDTKDNEVSTRTNSSLSNTYVPYVLSMPQPSTPIQQKMSPNRYEGKCTSSTKPYVPIKYVPANISEPVGVKKRHTHPTTLPGASDVKLGQSKTISNATVNNPYRKRAHVSQSTVALSVPERRLGSEKFPPHNADAPSESDIAVTCRPLCTPSASKLLNNEDKKTTNPTMLRKSSEFETCDGQQQGTKIRSTKSSARATTDNENDRLVRNPYATHTASLAAPGSSPRVASNGVLVKRKKFSNPYALSKPVNLDISRRPSGPRTPQARASHRPMMWLAAGYENQPGYTTTNARLCSEFSKEIDATRKEPRVSLADASTRNLFVVNPPRIDAPSSLQKKADDAKNTSPEIVASNGFMARKKKQTRGNSVRSGNISEDLASLRPASWSNTSKSVKKLAGLKPAPSKLAALGEKDYGIEQPGEDLLPTELRFALEDVDIVKDEHLSDLIQAAKVSSPLLNGWKLYHHQRRAVLMGIRMRRVIMALDMGLGKTAIGCVWSKAFSETFDCLKTIVICPVTMKEEWRRTALDTTGMVTEDSDSPPESLDMKICTWGKIPKEIPHCIGHFVIICDEAHLMQSMQSARTKNVLGLLKDKRCVGVMLLTGTPMKNGKPINLFPLLRAVRHPLGRHQKAYERHFCAGTERSFGGHTVWDNGGSSNLRQLQRLVGSHLLHLTKEQCLDLPKMIRESRFVPVSARYQIQYGQAVKYLADTHAAESDVGEAVLGAVQRLRSVCSEAKIEATVDIAKEVLETEASVVVFTSFVKVAKSIHKQMSDLGWEGEILTGETPPNKRQGLVDRFQQGLSAVMVCTFGAGGVGLTLTAARTIILLDRPWTHGDTRQAEDRVRRIGQTKEVKSIWVSAFDMDKEIDTMLESKKKTSEAVLGEEQTINGGISARISVPRLLALLQRPCIQPVEICLGKKR